MLENFSLDYKLNSVSDIHFCFSFLFFFAFPLSFPHPRIVLVEVQLVASLKGNKVQVMLNYAILAGLEDNERLKKYVVATISSQLKGLPYTKQHT